jgi:hypothetical protein
MLARRPKSAQAIAMRARIVLVCAEGLSNSVAAKKLHITGATPLLAPASRGRRLRAPAF